MRIVSVVERTTRNARKMRYYSATLDDGRTVQITKSLPGELFIDGVQVTDQESRKEVVYAISNAIKER